MPSKLSPQTLLLAFTQIGLTSIGGAAGPIRYVMVISRRWLAEVELAEGLAIAQVLPGAAVANLAVMIGDRFAGTLGAIAAMLGLCGPTLVIALVLAAFATHYSATSPRFAAAETAVTAGVAGLFVANGLRLGRRLWNGEAGELRRWRSGRVALAVTGATLVAGLHVSVPIAMIAIGAGSFVLESAQRRSSAAP